MRPVVLVALFAGLAAPALADDVNGDWCSPRGAHVFIDGSVVKTPGGQVIDGIYGHHSYSFVIPPGEADAGADFLMRQLSERSALVSIGGGEAIEWNRCEVTS